MAVTLTASLAQASIQPTAVHAGANVVTGTFNAGGSTLSVSGSGMVLLCKVPAGAKLVDLFEYHSTGANGGYTLNIGIRAGHEASTSFSAVQADLAQATVNGPSANFPITITTSDTANERFKYVTATLVSATETTSLKIRYSITYTLDSDQT